MIALVSLAFAYAPLSTCGGTPTHWEAPTTWRVTKAGSNPIYTGLSDAEVIAAIQAGFDVWSDTSTCCSGFEHQNGGTVTQAYSLQDNTNIISFEESDWDWSLGSVNGVIAVTFSQWAGGCRLTSGDQVFNGVGFDFTTSSNPGWGSTDLQSIAAHENGHWVGLDHSNVNGATMWFSYPGGISARSLHDDDEAGVCNAHPGTCGPDEPACPIDAELTCGSTVSGTTIGGANTVQSWSCANWQSTGPEAVYSFVSAVTGPVTVSLTDLSADLDLFVTASDGSTCNPGSCESTGGPDTSDEVLTIQATAGVTYTVVADGWEGAASNFLLSLDCPAGGNPSPPTPPPPDVPPTPPTEPTDPPVPDDSEDPLPDDTGTEGDPEVPAFRHLGQSRTCSSQGSPLGWLVLAVLPLLRRRNFTLALHDAEPVGHEG